MDHRTVAGALALAIAATAQPIVAADLRSHDTDFRETLAPGTTLEIDGVLGSIVATATPGNVVTIHAHATSQHDDPASVEVREVRSDRRLVVCAVYPNSNGSTCAHRSHGTGDRHSDVGVDFTVGLPAGIRLEANTVDGSVRAIGVRGDVKAATVQGDVTLATDGHASATAVNGSIDVRLRRTDWSEPAEFRTVNGAIHVTLARDANVSIDAETLNGAIRGDRGIPLIANDGEFVGHSATSKIGNGGSKLSLHTVNGSIAVGFD